MTLDKRQPLFEDDLWCKRTFDRRLPLTENTLLQKTTFDRRQPWMGDDLPSLCWSPYLGHLDTIPYWKYTSAPPLRPSVILVSGYSTLIEVKKKINHVFYAKSSMIFSCVATLYTVLSVCLRVCLFVPNSKIYPVHSVSKCQLYQTQPNWKTGILKMSHHS